MPHLCGNDPRVEKLDRADDAHRDIILGHACAIRRVVILIHIKSSISATSHKYVPVLGEMSDTPDGGLF